MTREEFIDSVEKAGLAGIDRHLNKLVHGEEAPEPYMVGQTKIVPEHAGWRDQDLDVLLPAFRAHAAVLWERFDIPKLLRDRKAAENSASLPKSKGTEIRPAIARA